MSEFSATEKDRVSPASPASSTRSASPGWWTRPIIAGLPLPGLIIVLLILVGAAWILFGPDSPPSVNQLAFREDIEPPHVTPEGTRPSHSALSPLETGGRQFKDEVATMIGGVRGYAETNRTAISTLSATVKSQGAVLATVQQQLAESQAQNSVLSARLSFLEGRPRAQAASQQPRKTQLTAKHVARTRSPLSGMRVEAIQKGMAWVYWQDRTWAVKAGDSVGPVTVTRIDAQAREVHTSAGTLK